MSELPLDFQKLNKTVVQCRLCPRLVSYREAVPARASFADQHYWRKPVPGYGDPQAWLVLLGLAPSAHGGNRTGRIFTGDASARFLIKALYDEGFANQPTSVAKDDGLILHGCYMTAMVKCVPPKDKPTREECLTCSRYWQHELRLLHNAKAILALGGMAFNAVCLFAKEHGHKTSGMKFKHGAHYTFEGLPMLYSSYHPSPQNTNTGKLSAEMFSSLLKQIKKELGSGL